MEERVKVGFCPCDKYQNLLCWPNITFCSFEEVRLFFVSSQLTNMNQFFLCDDILII